MITLKAPVELKTRTDFMRDHESFGERIAGNYNLIGLDIGAEELLHIVNSPPEIYVAEGGATTIVGNTLISSRNEEKLDIINNMLNRIMLSVNADLSYQDRAYITDALYKIGIRDDRKFMNEVKRMMSESRLEEDFINDYLAVSFDRENTELRRETLELSQEIVERGLESGLSIREENLSRNIMQRLQTGAIYQIVANFNKSLDETRINLAEQMISEQENTAKEMLVRSFLEEMVREGAEIIYRQEPPAEGETEEAEGGAAAAAPTEITAEPGRDREVYSELQSTSRETAVYTETERAVTPGADIIYREEEPYEVSEEDQGRLTERIRESITYEARNIYERELRSGILKEEKVGETINSAVLLDIVKNLYHTGYERISRSSAWTEYRGALYRSSENTINRVSYTTYESNPVTRISGIEQGDTNISLDYTEFEELSEIQENEGNIELIEQQIREMNEMNLANVSRYEQMREILKKLSPERRKTGGRERTRREALMALDDEKAIIRSLEEGEGEQEMRRREVFNEITRLFPDNAAQVFNVVQQYLENPEAVQNVNIVSGNVAQAAEELMRMQQANERAREAEIPEEIPPLQEGLVFRREDRLSEDELTEILDTYRRNESRQSQDISSSTDVTETRRINTTTVTQNTERNLTESELANIEDMVNRGVRSQMGAISEQVLTKLEKRLQNEKTRRGL